MEALVYLPWRVYPALALMVIGAGMLIWGARIAYHGLNRPISDPTRMQTFVGGLRVVVIGLALGGLGASWNWHLMWLFALSLAFGGEELMETSALLFVLRRWQPHNSIQKPVAALRETPVRA